MGPTKAQCIHCHYRWIQRVEKPKACPECRRRNPLGKGK